MSKVRKPIFKIANTSIQSCGRDPQRSLASAMLPPELGGHGLKLDRLLHHRIISVPLHKIGSAHERGMLAGAPVVVPEIEIHKADGLGEGRPGKEAVLA